MKEEVHPNMLNFVIAIFVAVPMDLAINIFAEKQASKVSIF
jgi:uncharacterized membrane protein